MPRHYSAALPIAYVMVRLLILLNWLLGAAILILLFLIPNREWIMSAFHIALAMLSAGSPHMGAQVQVRTPDGTRSATIVERPFHDPKKTIAVA